MQWSSNIRAASISLKCSHIAVVTASLHIDAHAQVRVLLKEPKGREVNDGDRFTYNAGLTEKLYRIKINSIQVELQLA